MVCEVSGPRTRPVAHNLNPASESALDPGHQEVSSAAVLPMQIFILMFVRLSVETSLNVTVYKTKKKKTDVRSDFLKLLKPSLKLH